MAWRIQLATINKISDAGISCFATLTLESGEPVFISVAQSGVVVKKSKTGLFGKVIFKGDAAQTAHLCMDLDSKYGDTDVPGSARNPVLKMFIKSALNARDVNELSSILSQ